MNTSISINGAAATASAYLTWTPLKSQIRLQNPGTIAGPVRVKLRNRNTAAGGQVVFYASPSGAGTDELILSLPVSGAGVTFLVGGIFGKPSAANLDGAIEVIQLAPAPIGNPVLSVTRVMVRVRKNANNLSAGEAQRFVAAMAQLNNAGAGPFVNFRDMHTSASNSQMHSRSVFLPWHRAYLLDLERELQNLDQSVTIPYWKFDAPAPSLFTKAFIGVPNAAGAVQFDLNNPLRFWKTDGVSGIVRQPAFNTATQGAQNSSGPVNTEAATLNMGGANNLYQLFRQMEGDPHGHAHVCFSGYVSSIPTAARDPLFFLLHANVDRLWAKWQWARNRFDISQVSTYTTAGSPNVNQDGIKLNDTMWPWNGITNTGGRPPTAPGGTFAPSSSVTAPGLMPKVSQTIDFHGVKALPSNLGSAYDDVPFVF
jgi:tyrosinase